MSRSEEYRRNAAQCILLAEETNDVANRLLMMEMAHAWLLLADQAEKNSHLDLTYETPPSQSQGLTAAGPAPQQLQQQQQQQTEPKEDSDKE